MNNTTKLNIIKFVSIIFIMLGCYHILFTGNLILACILTVFGAVCLMKGFVCPHCGKPIPMKLKLEDNTICPLCNRKINID